ncbi:MAG: TrmJ/YjtD family RNA methyltransferase [Nanoarchaeota archaeon]|nr:TrmJ/YjtD family RNA methyltransferase [Nanoarchaeota archaeon]
MKNIHIIAQEFTSSGNCGALARVLKNFDCKNLIFLNPKCDYQSKEAMDRATHAKDILKKAKVMKDFDKVLDSFDYVIGTTAMVGTDYNIPRSSINPEKLGKLIKKKKVGIIIGREGEGLSNKEIKKCDFTVSVPTSIKYPTMNVSHAAAIILYEIFKANENKSITDNIPSMTGKEKKALLSLIDDAIGRMGFPDEFRERTQRIVWKRVIGKSLLTKREAFALCGFFKRIK